MVNGLLLMRLTNARDLSGKAAFRQELPDVQDPALQIGEKIESR